MASNKMRDLSQIPVPYYTIPCQELVASMNRGHSGFLRRKKIGVLGSISFLSQMCSDSYFVVVCDGCLYLFKDEQQRKAEKAISLFGYTQVCRAGEFRPQKGLPWMFKLVYVLDEKGKVHYFSASSETEMKKWMNAMKKEMTVANCLSSLGDDNTSESEYSDLETPLSTASFFHNVRNIDAIKDQLGTDSDLDEDYMEIDMDKQSSSESPAPMDPDDTSSIKSHGSDTSDSKSGPNRPFRNLPPTPMSTPPPHSNKIHLKPLPIVPTPGSAEPQTKFNHPSQSRVGQEEVIAKPLPAPKPSHRAPPSRLKPAGDHPGVDRDVPPKDLPPAPPVPSRNRNVLTTPDADDDRWNMKSPESIERKLPMRYAPNQSAESSVPALPNAVKPIKNTQQGALPVPMSNKPTAPPKKVKNASVSLEAAAMFPGKPKVGNMLMIKLDEEGVYMIRESDSANSEKTLLVIADFGLRKYKILQNEDGEFSLQKSFSSKFDSVDNLLSYYRNNNLPNRDSKLARPYSEAELAMDDEYS